MEISSFRTLKEKVLLPFLEEIKREDELNCIRINYRLIDNIYVYYQKERNRIKKTFMTNNTVSLDRHKVGSCLIYAILRAQVIKINKHIPNIPYYLLMANEYFAINVAISIIEMYKRSEGDRYKEYMIIIPDSYHSSSEDNYVFLYDICVGLYNKNVKKNFDFFAYSTILFQLEDKTDYILGFRE